MFGDLERAAHWLDSPILALGGRTPREVATPTLKPFWLS
ncbi:MbcA/ParS/Xre antitoxin family protein [Geothrix sp.]